MATGLHQRRRAVGLLPVLLIGLAGCSVFEPINPFAAEPGRIGPNLEGPPPVTVRGAGQAFALDAWTYCFESMCVDGSPPANPPDVGLVQQVEFEFPLDEWTFEAEFAPVGEACPRRQRIAAEQTGDHSYVLTPAGRADTYDVTLFGRGNGDLFVTFRWTTPAHGAMPVPNGRLAVLADHDGRVDSYGVELELADLAATPKAATAEIRVSAANGRSLTFEPMRVEGCIAEGVVYWNGPADAGLQAAELGPAPFSYRVVVTLDGVEHTATASWPDDQIEGNEPSVALEFTPELPALVAPPS